MKLIKRAFALAVFLLASATASVAAESQQVGNFTFKDIDGKNHQFSEYRGKWVIVNYWATYCGPCIAELPALNSVANRFKDKAIVLGMEAGETPVEELKQFVKQRKITYPVAPTQDSTMFALGLLYGVPTTFVVNPKGEIVGSHMGAVTSAMLQNYLRNDNNSSLAKDKDKDENCKSVYC
ncbi:TlpA family protein disulfide reductase [Thiothrix nivea]|uniref:Alkyl hydroperoxide reductase/ Thiol specific antioxidant/ Mal allergen n=1 Tax=Thiothrix nivea (strain ATCC 35100 / DSM 5205 / JP2) TaxID=870187 RepID=A0A656HGJ1_THINJ|nr:redoxin domain-containing protein [Thiothrix nivea]EIJ34145.1 alkyl hydroperoxide reductase/ Thiol specific antioxidant/ Mal allergen [Thiothrix nivea DSM 5205]